MSTGRTIAALILLVISLTAAQADIVTSRPSDEEIRFATATCTRGTAKIATGVVGLSDPHAAEPGVIDLIAETGVKWVRAEFYWSEIEPVPGAGYHWQRYDAMVQAYNARGIRILGILTYVPTTQPHDWSAITNNFERFATAAVKRYGPRGVHYWEVFNEPNLTGYGWLSKNTPVREFLGAYTMLLARANFAVRTNDPQGVVVLGGLASDQHRGLPAEETMDVIYGQGARDCFDVMAFHPYGYQNRFPKARARIDALMAKGGDSGKPVWFTEYGWTDQAAMDMARNPTAATNPMMAAFAQRNSAGALFWFSAKDYSNKPGTPTFGLATFDLKKRPSFTTFRTLVEGLR